MNRFVPVIIAENPLESFSNERNSLLNAILAVSDPLRFMEPIIVTQAEWLETAVALAEDRAGNATFVAVPDGSSGAVLAAVGCVQADVDCKDIPILLMDARSDRAGFPDFARDVASSAATVSDGTVVEFIAGEMETGDYAMSFEGARDAYMAFAPMILSYAVKAAAHAGAEGNVVRLGDVPFHPCDSGSFRDVMRRAPELARTLHRQGEIDGLYTPWQTYSNSGFYAGSMRR